MALPPRAMTSSNVKMQNCWLRFETYHYSHSVRGLIDCQHSSQIKKRFCKELGNYRPVSLTLTSVTESVIKQINKHSLVKVNRLL